MTETFVIVKDHHHMINLNIFVSKKKYPVGIPFCSALCHSERSYSAIVHWVIWSRCRFSKDKFTKGKRMRSLYIIFPNHRWHWRKVTTKTLKRGDDKNLPSITDHRVWYSTLRRVGRFCKNISCTKTVKFAAYDGMAIELSLSYGVNFLICIVSSIQNTPSSRLWYKVT